MLTAINRNVYYAHCNQLEHAVCLLQSIETQTILIAINHLKQSAFQALEVSLHHCTLSSLHFIVWMKPHFLQLHIWFCENMQGNSYYILEFHFNYKIFIVQSVKVYPSQRLKPNPGHRNWQCTANWTILSAMVWVDDCYFQFDSKWNRMS